MDHTLSNIKGILLQRQPPRADIHSNSKNFPATLAYTAAQCVESQFSVQEKLEIRRKLVKDQSLFLANSAK